MSKHASLKQVAPIFATMITRQKLSARQHRAMLGMLAGLTPDERRMLEDPDFITEDEADVIVSRRDSQEGPAIPFEEVLAELGISLPRRRRSAWVAETLFGAARWVDSSQPAS